MKTIRLLSFHRVNNFGGILFAKGLQTAVQKTFPAADVRYADTATAAMTFNERAKVLRPFAGEPRFYAQRQRLFDQFRAAQLAYDSNLPKLMSWAKFERTARRLAWDAAIVGMDIWNVLEQYPYPKFPNVYWLPDGLRAKKIAYAVSGYQTDLAMAAKHKAELARRLDQFDLIGARDQFTYDLIAKHGLTNDDRLQSAPDLAFQYEFEDLNVRDKLAAHGVDFGRARLGLLLYGNPDLSQGIREQFKRRGYQIVALSAYNPFADVNLGHILTPPEWALAFGHMTAVVGAYFHGTVFALRNRTPVVSFKRGPYPDESSKILDLFRRFGLEDHYARVYQPGYQAEALAEQVEQAIATWADKQPRIEAELAAIQREHMQFQGRMRGIVN